MALIIAQHLNYRVLDVLRGIAVRQTCATQPKTLRAHCGYFQCSLPHLTDLNRQVFQQKEVISSNFAILLSECVCSYLCPFNLFEVVQTSLMRVHEAAAFSE